jgi:hypothetical protein
MLKGRQFVTEEETGGPDDMTEFEPGKEGASG